MTCAPSTLLCRFALLFCTFLFIGKTLGGAYPAGIIVQTFEFPDGTTDLADGSVIGNDRATPESPLSAQVAAGGLRLVTQTNLHSIGSFKLPNLDPLNVVGAFDVRFVVLMNSATASPGEGWSLNFGPLPEDNGTGEDGFVPLPGGLTVSFDPLDNGEGDSASIEILAGGVSLTNFPRAFPMDASPRGVVIHWDSFGLDLTFENRVIVTNLPTPGFAPSEGHRFAFTARTTTNAMEVRIDDLKVTTQPLPVIETGGPIISELMSNNDEFEDEFGDKSPWVELFNGSAQAVILDGWFLTDSKSNPKKWPIQALTLNPYNYLLVFASGRDRHLSTTSFLHTGFTLPKNNGYVALVRPDGSIASSHEYGAQEKNVSFGEKGAERKTGYMYPSTPGAVNTAEPAPNSLSPEVRYSHPGGFITNAVNVELFASGSAQIRYTLDRTEPGTNSPIYTSPIAIGRITTIKARSYAANHLPGRVTSRTFIPIDESLTNFAGTGKVFESNLPLIFVDSFGLSIDSSTGGQRPFRPSYTIVIAPDPATGRTSLNKTPEYAGPSGVHTRGESSSGFEQKSYALELEDDEGKDLDASLLGMPAESDWVLYGPWSEKTLMRNKLVFDWMRAIRGPDGTAVRSRFVELFFNQSRPASGKVGYTTYRGIYVLMEKLKRGGDRVPVEKINDKTIDPELITGGYIIRKDKDDSLKNNWQTARFGTPLQSFDPDRLNPAQLNYVKNYIASFENALNGASYRNFTNGYAAYIDADTFIDAQWMLEVAKQVDGYVFSTYWHKDRGGRLRAGPLWDFNISLGNADYASGDTPTGWAYNGTGIGQLWYPKLHSDPEYRLAHWDRYWQLRATVLDTNNILSSIGEHMIYLLDNYSGMVSNRAPVEIQNPVARHFRKWPRLGTRDWPNPAAETKITHWQAEVEYLMNWLVTRLRWMDDQSLRSGRIAYLPPVFSHAGGYVSGDVALSIAPYQRTDPATTFATGDIYYTLDNADPRLAGGAIGPSARKYSAPISIRQAGVVKARLLSQGVWSPLTSATFLRDILPATAATVAISEIMYRPAPPTPAETAAGIVDSSAFEFIELRNVARQAVSLAGLNFSRGLDFSFLYTQPHDQLVQPGESVLLVADRRAFTLRYPHVPASKVVGQFRGSLDSGGETLQLQTLDGITVKQFRYDDDAPWPGAGGSIVLRDPEANPNPALPANWTRSPGSGSPGLSGANAPFFIGMPNQDADGDGLADLFEFACGSNFEDSTSGARPSASMARLNIGGVEDNYATLTFQRNPNAQRVSIKLESSRDLAAWASAESDLVLLHSATNASGAVLETYRASAPASANTEQCQFYRLKVQQQP